MKRYDDFTSLIGAVTSTSRLTRLNESEVISIRKEYPHVPEDYLEYLREVGWGMIGDGYMVYSGPIGADEIYDQVSANHLKGILFFGDDLQGHCAGFNTSTNWTLVEVDPTNISVSEIGQSFQEFIKGMVNARFGAV